MDDVVQRDLEVAALTRQVERVAEGSGGVVVVEGPAGIGKSTLLGITTRIAQAAGVRVLRAWGSPLERDAGWGVARQLMAPVRRAPEWDGLATGAAALALVALDPHSERPPSAGDAMHAAAHGLTWLAYGLADQAPTVLVVDDAHWADAQSLRWLTQLSRSIGDLPLGIVCAVRPGERPADPTVLTELVATAGREVRPAPLDPDAVAAVIATRWPTGGSTFARACHAATGGNPFLLRALLDALADDDLAPCDELAARLTTFGPAEVTRSVERQLGRLPVGSADLAHAIAVLDRDVALRHAAELARLDPDRAARLVDRLCAAGLVESGEAGYTLVHPLVASALYGGLPAGERAVLHGRAAAILQRERADPETVALHLLRTEPFASAETVALLRLAALRASRRGAPDAAAAFLRRALQEPPADPDTEADLCSELGLNLAAQVRPGALALLRRAVDLAGAPAHRAQLTLSGARALAMAGAFDDAAELCRDGYRPDEDDVPVDLLDRVEAELVNLYLLDARTVDEGQRRLAARYDDRDDAPPVLPRLWPVIAAWRSQFDARPVAETRALLALLPPDALHDETDSLICTTAKFVHIFDEDLDTARALCDGLIDLARPRGWQIALAHGSFIRAFALVQAGRIREAAADGRSAFDFKIGNSPPAAVVWSLASFVDALVELDELDDADAALGRAWEQGEPPAEGLGVAIVTESRSRLRLAQGRLDEAIGDLRTAAGMWDRLHVRHPGLATWRVGMSQALVATGDRATAWRLAEEHRVLAERVGLPGPRAAALRAVATAVGGQQAVALLQQARDLVQDAPVRLEYVRTLVALGAALRRVNRRTDARDVLRQALDLAERGGMRLLARRARQELAATGARPRRNRTSGVSALTPAEHRVATLAAQGRSNPEIAQALFVTRRTVETHLTHAFTKLEIAARSELGAALAGID